ncbi:MAG: hypothetical protein HZY76_00470 [Anaerolineae bacterium]|nr:MAG: hypothetical protein HZY76_00470 [Anaerolineae bacterium]
MINNVETLAKVPSIVMHGPRWYGDLGTADSAGTKLFAVSGSVVRPGSTRPLWRAAAPPDRRHGRGLRRGAACRRC